MKQFQDDTGKRKQNYVGRREKIEANHKLVRLKNYFQEIGSTLESWTNSGSTL